MNLPETQRRRDYLRGWRYSGRPDANLDTADRCGWTDNRSWYDGYMDRAVGREQFASLDAPRCAYCGEPLTSNEYDYESGSYFSSHSRCSSEAPADGRFVVVVERDGIVEWFAQTWRYTTRRRAESQARHLADFNRSHLRFIVTDVGEGVSEPYGGPVLFSVTGRVPARKLVA